MAIIHNGKNVIGRYHGGTEIVAKYHGGSLVWQKNRLPVEYREVEYIESTDGNAYIKTGFTITTKSSCEIKQYCTGSITNGLIGNNGSVWFTAGNYNSIGLGLSALFCTESRKGTSIEDDNKVHTYYISNGKTRIDEKENEIPTVTSVKVSHYESNPYSDYEFGLGRCNTAYSFNQTGTNRIYNCKLWDDNDLVRNFIPCVRVDDRKAGMYDTVTKTFYSSVTSTNFKHGAYKDTFARICTELEYIESTGSQYIDTDYVRTGNTNKVEVKYNFLSTNTTNGCTVYGYSKSLVRTPYITNFNETGSSKLAIYGSGGKWLSFTSARDTVHTSVIETNNQNKTWKFTHDNQELANGSFPSGTTTLCGVSSALFAVKNPTDEKPNNVTEFSKSRIYYYKEYDNNVLVRELIPCKYKGTGKIGMYDTVSGDIFVSETKSEFIASGEIPEEYTPKSYIQSSGTQYLDTGIKVNKNMKFNAVSQLTKLDATNSNGITYTMSGNVLYRFQWAVVNSKFWLGCRGDSWNTVNVDSNAHTFSVNLKNNIGSVDNITHNFSGSEKDITDLHSFILCAQWIGGESRVGSWAYEKLYLFKMYENDVLIGNFIPCVRKSDNIAGMYDTIGKKFYKSATSTNFSAG